MTMIEISSEGNDSCRPLLRQARVACILALGSRYLLGSGS
jgi:hypothetical protein